MRRRGSGPVGGDVSDEDGAHARLSEVTPAIQGHPLAPAAWHGTMERALVLVLFTVQGGRGQSLAKEVHRLLLVQAPNPRTEPHCISPSRGSKF